MAREFRKSVSEPGRACDPRSLVLRTLTGSDHAPSGPYLTTAAVRQHPMVEAVLTRGWVNPIGMLATFLQSTHRLIIDDNIRVALALFFKARPAHAPRTNCQDPTGTNNGIATSSADILDVLPRMPEVWILMAVAFHTTTLPLHLPVRLRGGRGCLS